MIFRLLCLLFSCNSLKKSNICIRNNVCGNCLYYKERVQFDSSNKTSYISICRKFGVVNLETGYIDFEKTIQCRNDENKCGINGDYFEEKKEKDKHLM